MSRVPGVLEQRNISLVGYHDLNDRPGFKMGIHQAGGRWYLYVAHLWHSGWSVLDVTEPANPVLRNFIEGPANTWTIQIQVAGGKMITSLEQPIPGWYAVDAPMDPEGPYEEGIYIWDISTDPVHPRFLSHFPTGGRGTHRNYYDGGRYAFLSAHPPGFKRYCLVIIDLEDPTSPREVSRWWWPGQGPGADDAGLGNFFFHGPAYPVGDRAYLSYGRCGVVILDISDIRRPQLVSQVSFGDLGSFLGTHTVVPVHGTNLLVANSEAIQEGANEPLNYVFVIDVGDERNPRIISSFPQPQPEPGLPYKNYYEKGGRFGPHNQHHYQYHPNLHQPRDLVAMTYFNAGLRIFSIADPLAPVEVGCFVPEDPVKRIGSLPKTLVTQFEDVLWDARGYLYCTDKNHGLFILRYDGPGAEEVAVAGAGPA